ncbi:progranulin-like [Chanos chanos]|uniref:Progranulin-like n=1 Tax=Chanos chanos TaxID=29144 RepID=A0A6J2WFU6_CHACN|nr:progranulin-like [Chanos chanos]
MKMIAVVMLLMVGLVTSSTVCPDGNECPDDYTCCKTQSGYGCCPAPHAVCCADEKHCCPEGYICNLSTGQCDKAGLPFFKGPLLRQVPAKEPETLRSAAVGSESVSVSVVYCDSYTVCPDRTTCCKSPYGQWYCCPYSMGSCCRDGVHCCPHGYQCDPTSTYCRRGGFSLLASPRLPSQRVETTEE